MYLQVVTQQPIFKDDNRQGIHRQEKILVETECQNFQYSELACLGTCKYYNHNWISAGDNPI